MGDGLFDVLIIGAGPAGSIAALVLARAGAHVALVDKVGFPREKACGDLVGPRGVQVLEDLAIAVPGSIPIGDMVVVGPTGRRVRLPCFPGLTYPGLGLAVPRATFDDLLRNEAIAAGAMPFEGQATEAIDGDDGLEGFVLNSGVRLRGDAVIGADGATSRVAAVNGMAEHGRVMWGFAIRSYLAEPVCLPHIVLWEPSPWHALPGYGWLFPGPDGRANVGLGVGTLTDRTSASAAVQLLPAFLEHLRRLGLLAFRPQPAARLGGWLKMGIVGTTPAAGRVLLVGDAAGLVNPLQGEGISQALSSGRAAADAILAGPDQAATRYTACLAAEHVPYHQIAAATQAALLPRPKAVASVGRILTLPGIGAALSGGWSIFWNELHDGAAPGAARSTAGIAVAVGRAVTAHTATRRWFDENLRATPPPSVTRNRW
ncbi:MAG: geranylgeranyl reductase family protein [Gemmatimonadales bacterium]|nr:geranylgeranyl reductase family protein [Gemmatimonadales bacterium]